MKNFARAAMAMILGACALAGCATDAARPAEAFKQRLAATDCEADPAACHRFAALEFVAYVKTCPGAIAKITGKSFSPKEMEQIDSAVRDWRPLGSAQERRRLLDEKNPDPDLVAVVEIHRDYLAHSPADDVGIECSRLGYALQGQEVALEDQSNLLMSTRGYGQWREKRDAQQGVARRSRR